MQNQTPKVSVIIPMYNDQDYVADALESVIAQTYSNLEIICIDDHSQDQSRKIVQGYQDTFPIKLFTLTKNHGPSYARNQGIESSSGEYILPLDADDKIDPTYIEKAVEVINSNHEVSVVYSKGRLFGTINTLWKLPPYNAKKMSTRNLVPNCALYRKADWERYKGYNESMIYGYEDWDFWLYFVEEKKIFHQIDEVLFFYRQKTVSRNTQAVKIKAQRHTHKVIRKNHPCLFTYSAFIKNPYLILSLLQNIRRFLIQIKIQKTTTIIRILGIYVIQKET